MSSKIDPAMLKNPDVFVSTSDHIFDFIEKHSKTFLTVAIVALMGAVGYVIYGYINSSREIKAAEAIYRPEAELKKAQSDVREARAKKMQELAAGDKSKKSAAAAEMVRPSDFAKDYAKAVDKVKAQIQAHADTKSALVAAMNLSYFLSEQKQFPQALEVLDLIKFKPAASDLLDGFWQMHRGLTLSENGKLDPATEAYETVIKSPSLKVFHPEALLKLGVIYQGKGDVAKARDTLEKLTREFPEGEATSTAKQYLRLIELQARKAS